MLKQDKGMIYNAIENKLQSNGNDAVMMPVGVGGNYCTSADHNYNAFGNEPLAQFGTMQVNLQMNHLPWELKEYIHRQVLHAVSQILDGIQSWEEFSEEYKRKMDEMLLGEDIAG